MKIKLFDYQEDMKRWIEGALCLHRSVMAQMPTGTESVKAVSIQWLAKHWDEMGEEPGMIVIAEAHHALADTYKVLWGEISEGEVPGADGDCPDVEFIQLARPTLSLAKYLQMVGRGLRVTKGKMACVIIDNVGLYRMYGSFAESEWAMGYQKTGINCKMKK